MACSFVNFNFKIRNDQEKSTLFITWAFLLPGPPFNTAKEYTAGFGSAPD